MSARQYTFVFLLVVCCAQICSANNIASQKVMYSSTDAEEVFLVWGINNWSIPAHELLPANSFLKDNLVYTPLIKKNGVFEASIRLPQNTMLDYVFWITKGPRGAGTDLWDTNQPEKDYHTKVGANADVFVNAKVKARPSEDLTVLEFARPLFWILLCCSLFLWWCLKRKFIVLQSVNRRVVNMVAMALSIAFFLFLSRPSVLGLGWEIYLNPLEHVGQMISASFHDVLFVFVLLGGFLILHLITKRWNRINRMIPVFFGVAGIAVVLFSILNIRVVQMLGRPFNYQWLYYSDFLRSADSRLALSANLSGDYVFKICLLFASMGLFTYLLFVLLNVLWFRLRFRKINLLVFFCVFASYATYSNKTITEKKWAYDKLVNPVTAFLQSVNPFAAQPELFTMMVNDTLNEFRNREESRLQQLPRTGIKNVIFFVLESTPAEYLDVYGSKYKVTPHLNEYSSRALVFNNVYAHAPATNLSMVSLLSSIYPWLSYNSLTQEHPDLAVPTINAELKTAGYRSAFFNSADNRFQNAGDFLRLHHFDSISDYTSRSCSENVFQTNSDWEYMDGKSDACTAKEISSWIAEQPTVPFFAVMWTYQTHYPYFFEGAEENYSDDKFFNRYLNALRHTDEVFGRLMQSLKEQGQADSTLVVVVGDHGEAFGRHDQITHGRKIYEENLHVPLMLIHPSFTGTRNNQVAGLIDIAPTVLHLLEKPAPHEWQGTSLFAENRSPRTYFFAPWSDFLFGYRENDYKFIYNATRNESELYDLSKDPCESTNLAEKFPEMMDQSHHRLASWAQYVNLETQKFIAKKESGLSEVSVKH